MKIIQWLASLKFTWVLFLGAMVIVFVGSLAQSRRDVWQVMAECFRQPYPARSTIEVSGLPKAAQVEVDAVMVLD